MLYTDTGLLVILWQLDFLFMHSSVKLLLFVFFLHGNFFTTLVSIAQTDWALPKFRFSIHYTNAHRKLTHKKLNIKQKLIMYTEAKYS